MEPSYGPDAAVPARVTRPVTWGQADTDRWLQTAEQREAGLRPIQDLLLDAAALQPGERVLDVGCGTGPTTAAAAAAVRPGGTVVGLDLAPELVAVARERVTAPEVEWLVADAATAPLPPGSVDVVLSRFGVMFFADPVAAFTHLARLTRPGGRLVATVWPPRTEVEQFTLPYEAARRALDRAGLRYTEPDPDRGPFSLGDPDFLEGVLTDAGWERVAVRTHHLDLPLAGPGTDPARVARHWLDTGHAGVLLTDRPEALRVEAERDLTQTYAGRMTEDGLRFGAAVRLVTAVRAGRA